MRDLEIELFQKHVCILGDEMYILIYNKHTAQLTSSVQQAIP